MSKPFFTLCFSVLIPNLWTIKPLRTALSATRNTPARSPMRTAMKPRETYTVAVPIRTSPFMCTALEQALGRTITGENRVNAAQNYSRVFYGYGSRMTSISAWGRMKLGGVFDGEIYTGDGDFASPLGADGAAWSPLNSAGDRTHSAAVARGIPSSPVWERPRVRPYRRPNRHRQLCEELRKQRLRLPSVHRSRRWHGHTFTHTAPRSMPVPGRLCSRAM